MQEGDSSLVTGAESARLGPYTLVEPLGEGGMARVFLARRDGARAPCVLKRLHVQLEGHPIALKRFQREAHIAALLDHPNIARIVDAGMERGGFFLAMELIAGETLEHVIARATSRFGALPEPVALAIVKQVLDALAYAHEMTEEGRPLRIVHRDLTPRNVMITYDGTAKVIDFGIARGDVDEFKTAPGVLMGTPYYMSPEQAMTEPVDQRSDLYTFAAVLFEMFAGRRLVRQAGRAQVLLAVATEPAPPLSSVAPTAPRALEPVLARALAKAPDDRYPTARALAQAIAAATESRPRASRSEMAALMRELFPAGEAAARARLAMPDPAPEAEPTRTTRSRAPAPTRPDPATVAEGARARTPVSTPPRAEAPVPPAIAPPATTDPRFLVTHPALPSGSLPGLSSPSMAEARAAHRASVLRARLFGGGALVFLGGLVFLLFSVAREPLPAPTRAEDPVRVHEVAETKVEVRARPAAEVAREVAAEPKGTEAPPREDRLGSRADVRTETKPKSTDAKSAPREEAKSKEAQSAQPAREASRFTDLHRQLARLEQSPDEAQLRTQIHDRIESESERLPAKRRARIQAAIDEALRSLETEGLARGLRELEEAARAGELP